MLQPDSTASSGAPYFCIIAILYHNPMHHELQCIMDYIMCVIYHAVTVIHSFSYMSGSASLAISGSKCCVARMKKKNFTSFSQKLRLIVPVMV